MNKSDLIAHLVEMTGVPRSEALRFFDALLWVISEEIAREEGKVALAGFGTFRTTVRRRKVGRNPRTGEEMVIPKQTAVKFMPGKRLKDEVR